MDSVTPCMGVWIETDPLVCKMCALNSHTLYGCVDWNILATLWLLPNHSHTLYGCVDWNAYGWPRMIRFHVTPCMGVWIETRLDQEARRQQIVTPCMGVWIETQKCYSMFWLIQVTPCMGVWIETTISSSTAHRLWSHTLYGCVDWNKSIRCNRTYKIGHTLYGCVDWNLHSHYKPQRQTVTPCMGVWIETYWCA